MVTLRNFNHADAAVLQQSQNFDMSAKEIQDMIGNWNKFEFQGKYFEMFAIMNGGKIVGTISLYQLSDSVISIGPEIFSAFQNQGFGKEAMLIALDLAKSKGYRIVAQQVRADNIPSIALHKRLGFETDRYGYINRKGKEVFLFFKALFETEEKSV